MIHSHSTGNLEGGCKTDLPSSKGFDETNPDLTHKNHQKLR
jgi:hypothetical protein